MTVLSNYSPLFVLRNANIKIAFGNSIQNIQHKFLAIRLFKFHFRLEIVLKPEHLEFLIMVSFLNLRSKIK